MFELAPLFRDHEIADMIAVRAKACVQFARFAAAHPDDVEAEAAHAYLLADLDIISMLAVKYLSVTLDQVATILKKYRFDDEDQALAVMLAESAMTGAAVDLASVLPLREVQ